MGISTRAFRSIERKVKPTVSSGLMVCYCLDKILLIMHLFEEDQNGFNLNSSNKKDYLGLDLLIAIIFIFTCLAVVFLFGFIKDNIIISAEGFSGNSTTAFTATTATDNNVGNSITKVRGNVTGIVTHIVDGDTLDLNINGTVNRIRFAFVNTQERGQAGYKEAKDFVASTCPIGSTALVDPDNGQKLSFGRVVGVVYCFDDGNGEENGEEGNDNDSNKAANVNQALLENNYAMAVTRFCGVSEFSHKNWIKDKCNTVND